MKRMVVAMAAILAAGTALAQQRPSTVTRPCSESQRDVQRSGAIVLGTGGHTFDRFVRDRSFCQFDEFLDPAWVPSRDLPACFVGYRCKVGPVWD
jgi:hypothetical protein